MNQRQREAFADKLMEVGNLAVGALLLGQFLAKEFNWVWTVAGGAIWVLCYAAAFWLLEGEGARR